MVGMDGGRYRPRTWLRGRLPVALADRVPKGARDCGEHEWYRADAGTWRCYHCKPGLSRSSPWSSEEQLQHTLGGIDSTLRVLALRGEPGGEQELAELRRLVQEALAVWPQEEQRLERLAAAPAAELPGLVQALHAG
jgi:ribosomal protein L37AE/L43A